MSLFIRLFYRSVCLLLFLFVPPHSALHFIHSTCFSISAAISLLAIFLILSLSLSFTLSHFSRYSSISLSTSIRSGKVVNVGRISRISWVGCQTPPRDFLFPRARARDMATWRAASRFVLSYCRGLSHRCVLTTAARPMHDPSDSGSLGYPAVLLRFVSLPLPFSFARSLSAPHLSRSLPLSANSDRATRNHAEI